MDGDRMLHSTATAELMAWFNDAFLNHAPDLLAPLVAEDCVIENTVPAPDGSRHVGRMACLALWQGIAANQAARFELEEVEAWEIGDEGRAIIRWRYRWGEGADESVRGINLMRAKGGLIVEALGYVKGKG